MTVQEFLALDHERLDLLLRKALDGDSDAYREFRSGLLWHIGVEEKILFPLVRRERGESDIEQIRAILEVHNPLEEDPGKFYDIVASIGDPGALLEQVRAFPPVRTAPHADTEVTRWSIDELVRLAEEGRSSER